MSCRESREGWNTISLVNILAPQGQKTIFPIRLIFEHSYNAIFPMAVGAGRLP